MEKAHVAAGGPFCGMRFYTVLSVAAPIFGRFTQFCLSLPQKLDFFRWSGHRAFSMLALLRNFKLILISAGEG